MLGQSVTKNGPLARPGQSAPVTSEAKSMHTQHQRLLSDCCLMHSQDSENHESRCCINSMRGGFRLASSVIAEGQLRDQQYTPQLPRSNPVLSYVQKH